MDSHLYCEGMKGNNSLKRKRLNDLFFLANAWGVCEITF